MSTDQYAFTGNEKVLCYHGPLIYEAKVVQAAQEDGCAKYLVHYKGWKQTWDEWVPEGRMLKYNEANLILQKRLYEESKAKGGNGTKAQSKAPAAGARNTRDKGIQRGQKRAHDDENGTRQVQMKLIVPEILKCQLVDDWEAVTKNNSVVTLPRKPTVKRMLEDFEQHVLETKPPSLREPELLTKTVANGIQAYFDRSLGTQLLYRFERLQYSEVRKAYVTGQTVKVEETPEWSDVYGAEHLLRMLVAFPQMVSQATLDAESVTLLQEYVNELLNWMAEHKSELFQLEYEIKSPMYQNVSRS